MNETLAGIVLLLVVFGGLFVFAGGSIRPDYSAEPDIQTGTTAHPLDN